eukprot:Tbor_TRINITY_DN4347_c0_g1::TRINITY_DN4347_c0_g1_i1::g.7814::m.7814
MPMQTHGLFFSAKKAENKKMNQSGAAALSATVQKGKRKRNVPKDSSNNEVFIDDSGRVADLPDPDDDHNHYLGEDSMSGDEAVNGSHAQGSSSNSYQHKPNGLDVLFGIIQRNPTIMYPPDNHFEARDIVVREAASICLPSGGCSKSLQTTPGCSPDEDDPLFELPEGSQGCSPSTRARRKSRLEEMTTQDGSSDATLQGGLSMKDQKESQLQKMMALLGQRLSGPGTGSSGEASAVSTGDKEKDRGASGELMDERTKANIAAQRDHEALLHAATFHHKQLDAYIACLYEFNHTVFGTLPLKDMLYQMHKVGVKGQAHLASFEEHHRAARKAELLRRVREIGKDGNVSLSANKEPLPQSVTSQASATAAAGTTASSIKVPDVQAEPRLTARQEDEYFNTMIAEAEENAKKVISMGLDDIDDEELAMQASLPIHQDGEMDPYQYMMMYGMPPPQVNDTSSYH